MDEVVEHDGKILVGGSAMGAADGVLLRYNQDGTLDPSFGTGGRVAVNSNQGFALQKDGRIVVGGTLLKRYNADGSVDTTFTTEFLGTPRAPTIEPDDKIIILTNVGLQRFNADGSLDLNFGVGRSEEHTSELQSHLNL